MTKKAAVINDLSGFGKCSLTAAIPVLSALGIQCCPLPTAVLTGQSGYSYYHCTDLTEMMPRYTDAWSQNGARFDAIYSGYMTGHRQIAFLLDFISVFRTKDTFLLVDPVMGDDGRVYGMYSGELLSGMQELSRKADLITPNLMEACLLLNEDYTKVFSVSDPEKLLETAEAFAKRLRLFAKQAQDVVITGIKCRDPKQPYICNLALTDRGVHISRNPFYDTSYSGTGDLFSSIMCGYRLNGFSTEESTDAAGRFLYDCILDTAREKTPPNDGICFEKNLHKLIKGGLY